MDTSPKWSDACFHRRTFRVIFRLTQERPPQGHLQELLMGRREALLHAGNEQKLLDEPLSCQLLQEKKKERRMKLLRAVRGHTHTHTQAHTTLGNGGSAAAAQ